MSDKKETICFGEHVTLDGYGGNPEKLNDRETVLSVLNDLPDKLGMTKLAEPVLYEAEGGSPKDSGGWTGVVVIKESHISIHTFPGRHFVSADVYTCKNGMNIDLIKEYFIEKFDLKDIEEHFIHRGTRYPKEDL